VVLVLDDDRATRDLVQEILEEQGYTVESAASGASGLARLESGGIDLVVLDRTLPDRDGLDVCRWVRAREDSDRAHLPIIMVSASVPAGEETMEPGPGADAYVAKPFDIDALVAQVRSSLGTPPPDQAPAPTAPR
jgi:DNA-binding response OmpR family regulator